MCNVLVIVAKAIIDDFRLKNTNSLNLVLYYKALIELEIVA